MAKHFYGWVKDEKDDRDFVASYRWFAAKPPKWVDQRPAMPAIYDQLTLGSCTAHGVATPAVQAEMQGKNPDPNFLPSRLFIYYISRMLEDNIDQDAGAQIRDVIKAVAKYGMPPETLWPYDISKFTDKPPPSVWTAARSETIKLYARVPQTDPGIKGALASGLPVVFGTLLFESFESDEVAETGIVPMPSQTDSPIGGHCMDWVGYDCWLDKDSNIVPGLVVRNSWSVEWGLQGYAVVPWAYMLNGDLTSDLWIIKALSK